MSGAINRLAGAVLSLLILCACGATAARADTEIPAGSAILEVLDRAGNRDNRAGIHPDRLLTRMIPPGEGAGNSPKEMIVDFPPGLGGDPQSVPACPRAVFDGNVPPGACPAESQVGTFRLLRASGEEQFFPIYSISTAPGEVAAFGVTIVGLAYIRFSGRLNPDGSLRMTMLGFTQAPEEGVNPLTTTRETVIEFWGIPADHQKETSIPRRPFLTTPTRCDGPIALDIRLRLWQQGDEWFRGSADAGAALQGCQSLPFAPGVALKLERPVVDVPTGVDIDMTFPQGADPDGLASSQVRSTAIELPRGMSLSPAAASRLGVCSDAQLSAGTDAEARCPANSKVGSAVIGAPQLNAPLQGKVYLGEAHPGERFRIFVVASGEGVEAKFAGAMRSDPVTGRLTTVLNDLPQISFARLLMHFDGGERALLVNPLECGATSIDATIVPYSGTVPVKTSAGDTVGAQPGRKCGAFDPSLSATASTARPGRPTTFSALIGRRDGEQAAERFSIDLPRGFSARLSSVGLCSAAAAAAASCPVASRIGRAFAAVGAGADAVELNGSAYLTGPYRGAPFGFALAFDAAIGPFDFGTVSIRGALKLDPETGQVSVRSDPLPQAFEGVPIRFQTLGLEIDRPGFLRTPTSCGPKAVTTTVVSTGKALAHPGDTVPMHGCVGLPFRPSFSLALSGRSQLHRDGKPGLRIRMRGRKGDANLRALSLSMPPVLKFDGGALKEICSRSAAIRGDCPKGSRVGSASALSELLDEPLKGSVHVVQPKGDGQPDIWTSIEAQGIRVNLKSESSFVDGHLVTRFRELPDMPLKALSMRLTGGAGGVFKLAHGLCGHGRTGALSVPTSIEGQNAMRRESRLPIALPDRC
jgi:hypothetical protein